MNTPERLYGLLLFCLAAVFASVAQAETDMVEPPHVPVVVEQPEAPLSESTAMESLAAGVNDIAVLFLYTPDTVRHYGSVAAVTSRIDQLVSFANAAYSNSGINLQIATAGSDLVNYDNNNISATAFSHLANKTHIAFANVNRRRMELAADFVVLLRPQKSDSQVCGKAYFVGDVVDPANNYWIFGGYAYAHVSINCHAFVLAHELGHIMGLAHARDAIGEPTAGKAYAYGAGYRVANDFRTVMGSTWGYYPLPTTYSQLPVFSSPAAQCVGKTGIAKPCGVDSSLSNGADAVLAINNIAAQLPKFSDDSDSDGMPDWFEYFWGLNRFAAADAPQDADGDGLSNLNEFYTESYAKAVSGVSLAQARDTDGDGVLDGADPFPTMTGTPVFSLEALFSGSGLRESVQP